MKKILFALFICVGLMGCEKDEIPTVTESQLLGQWVAIGSYPFVYTLDIKNLKGEPTPDIFTLQGNTLYWDDTRLGKHVFTITKLEGDIMVVDEGQFQDISFKKIKSY